MAITEIEAREVSSAIDELAKHYGVQVAGVAMLWINLAGTMAMVYGPKILIMRAMIQFARSNKAQPAQDGGNVYPIRPDQPSAESVNAGLDVMGGLKPADPSTAMPEPEGFTRQ